MVTIDPRRHDAVVLEVTNAAAAATFVQDLCWTGLTVGSLRDHPSAPVERTVVVSDSPEILAAGRSRGCALVIGVCDDGAADELLQYADSVVGDLTEIDIRTGDVPARRLPDALSSRVALFPLLARRKPLVCLDFDGTLSSIVADPGSATLIDGAAETLEHLASLCSVAVVSGRDLDDVRSRVGVPGLWYAGSHGMELAGPDGQTYRPPVAAVAEHKLAEAAAQLQVRLAHVAGALVEAKRYSVAVHYRAVERCHHHEVLELAAVCARQLGLRQVHGRKVVDLRCDLDWTKGTAVRWMCSHLPSRERVLPIYIGDDLTDEDAFDAVQMSGVAVLVCHNEDDGRRTAARFTVGGPTEVYAFLRLLAEWLEQSQHTDSAWTFGFDGYDPTAERLREALCAVGNGYVASRAAAPECRAGSLHYPGTYVAGIFNRLDDRVGGQSTQHESAVNLPNWLPLTFRIENGPWFDIDSVSVLSYRLSFDLRAAVVRRELIFRDAAGRETSVEQDLFVSMYDAHLAVLTTRLSPQNWSGTVEFRSTIDTDVRNGAVERYRELNSVHLAQIRAESGDDDIAVTVVKTTQSGVTVALATRTFISDDVGPCRRHVVREAREVGHCFATEVTADRAVSVDKVVCIVTSRDVAVSDPADHAVRALKRLVDPRDLRRAHELRWDHLWERMLIEFDGHAEELRVLRLHLLHLLQTVSPNTADSDAGVPARGLAGEAYRGHVFWDELFILPVLNLRFPAITASALRYRYRRLGEARQAARNSGYAGAMFPWQSGSDGREESPRMHLNPRSGHWNPDPSHRAHHVGIAVAYNVWQYYQTTADVAYLIDFGAEMLVEIARFWVSRTSYDVGRKRYCINGVIGPDEFHTGSAEHPFEGINNNAYTNVMAVWVIIRAGEALDLLPLPARLDLRERLGITDSELLRWDDVSRNIFVPFHEEMISQFEGYENLQELDWTSYRTRYDNIGRLDRILEAEGDDVNRYRAAKQADVLMLLYLLSSDELREILGRLRYRLDPDRIPAMVDYYLARTSHGSTLSAVVNTWVLARANRDRALDFFDQVLASDVADIQGGTTAEGIHLAAMAGSVDLVQRCFTGLETRCDRLVLSPSWPKTEPPLAGSLHYRGQHLHVRVSGRGAQVSAEFRPDAVPVLIECRGRVASLMPGQTLTFEA